MALTFAIEIRRPRADSAVPATLLAPPRSCRSRSVARPLGRARGAPRDDQEGGAAGAEAALSRVLRGGGRHARSDRETDPTRRLPLRPGRRPPDRGRQDRELIATARPGSSASIACLRQDVAERNFGFYSACEFDVEALVARRPDMRFLEVGRACIAPTHRGKHVLELLWRGLWTYARRHRIDAMIGCASLPGADAAAHAGAIAALAAGGGDPAWRVAPRADRLEAGAEGIGAEPADPRALLRVLPPLVKGYWRLGATFSPISGRRPRLRHDRPFRGHAALARSKRATCNISESRRSRRRSRRERNLRAGIPIAAEFGYGGFRRRIDPPSAMRP